jgi:peptidyl-prolyl cis-trans isomerase A (cyclophilin A)
MRYLLILCLLTACSQTKHKNPHVEIRTAFGNIELELYPDQAPKTVTAFLGYIEAGLYKRTSFYRVLNIDNQPSNAPKAELIQGGLYGQKGRKEQPGIPHETTEQTKIKHQNGVISLARLEPGTASTEFFICLGDQPGLDFGGENNPDGQGYAAFGRVVKGMDVVRKIYQQPEDGQYFAPRVDIVDIVRL